MGSQGRLLGDVPSSHPVAFPVSSRAVSNARIVLSTTSQGRKVEEADLSLYTGLMNVRIIFPHLIAS